MKRYQVVSTFRGYHNKKDITNIGDGFLVTGSQNVVGTTQGTVSIRDGYSLYGSAGAGTDAITWSFECLPRRGRQMALRFYDDELEFMYEDEWYRLADGWTNSTWDADTYWDDVEGQDAVLLVNGDDNVHYWSTGIATFASATANTITKEGASSWAEEGFLSAGTRRVIIGGTAYTYTGGESTTTLTGVTPNPTLAGHAVGAVCHQQIRTTATTPASGLQNDIIKVLNNQVYIAGTNARQIYKSVVNDYSNFTAPSSPRIVGESAIITVDGTVNALIPQEDSMYVSAGLSQWLQSAFVLSSDNVNEVLQFRQLNSGEQQGAHSQSAVARAKNKIVYITKEPTLDELGRIENINTPQSKPLSDSIKNDFDTLDFTNAHVRYYRNNLYVALPNESQLLVYNIEEGYWEAPWTLPAGRLAIISDELYLHSSATNETYKLFDGTSDNGSPILAIAKFSYQNWGDRANKKRFDEWFTEGYIQENTTLTCTLNYDYTGSTGSTDFNILGTDDTILFKNVNFGGLGKVGLGQFPLGGSEDTDALAKFRHYKGIVENDIYELQPIYESYGDDAKWEIVGFGPNAKASPANNNDLVK